MTTSTALQDAAREATEFANPNLEELISSEMLKTRIAELGEQITSDYQGKELVLVGVLKGSCIFMADLMRAIDLRVTIDFMAVSSYQDGTVSTGDVVIFKDLTQSIRDKHVIIIEDIIDTGQTLFHLMELLQTRGCSSIKIAALLDKPDPRIKKEVVVDYCGFQIPNKFVVGYGLDAAERYRNLPFIGVVKDPSAA
jgi:hypoxanthine phosphoribosyltransferase